MRLINASRYVKSGLLTAVALVALGGFGFYDLPLQQTQISDSFNQNASVTVAQKAAPQFFKGLARGMARSADEASKLRARENEEIFKQSKIIHSTFAFPHRT